jgi:dGTPase
MRYREKAIDNLIHATIEFFMDKLLEGRKSGPILRGDIKSILEHDDFKYKKPLERIRDLSKSKIYWYKEKLELEEAGGRIIQGLLDRMIPTVLDPENFLSMSQKLLDSLIPELEPRISLTQYQKIQAVTDYISGMTDQYALNLHRKFQGISL